MGLNPFCVVVLFLLVLTFPLPYECISAHGQNWKPVHVILGKTLLLKVDYDLTNGEQMARILWERDIKNPNMKVTLAEFPGQSTDQRVKLNKNGTELEVSHFHQKDNGIYTVTVFSQIHTFDSVSYVVREYEAIHHVSVSINMSHTLLLCKEAWGTEPQYSWLHEHSAVPEDVGHPSADGQVLYLSSEPCGHFTCVVRNNLGEESDNYTAAPCQISEGSTTLAVVFVIILLSCLGVLAFFVWRRHRQHNRHGERLREPHGIHL